MPEHANALDQPPTSVKTEHAQTECALKFYNPKTGCRNKYWLGQHNKVKCQSPLGQELTITYWGGGGGKVFLSQLGTAAAVSGGSLQPAENQGQQTQVMVPTETRHAQVAGRWGNQA